MGSDWIVDLSPVTGDGSALDPDATSLELMAALTLVLFEASLATWDRHKQAIESAYERGLHHKLTAGRPYDDVAGVVPRDVFDKMNRPNIRLPDEWRTADAPEPGSALRWRKEPGPGYTRRKSGDMIANRYRKSTEILRLTLPRLADDQEFQATYRELLRRGWKDWHVLLALANARFMLRSRRERPTRAEIDDLIQNPALPGVETPDEKPLPRRYLTTECLTHMRRMGFLAGAQLWGLEVHQDTPDLDALERLLGDRYGYWTDDAPHPALFAVAPGG